MQIHSAHSKKEYLSAIKSRRESHFAFGKERLTGFFLGSLFSVTYHSGHEWNRRITNETNTAIGYVQKVNGSCIVRCFLLKGLLAPSSFLLTLLMTVALFLFFVFHGGEVALIPLCLPICLGITLVVAIVEAFIESMTERSEEGCKILKSILLDPSDPFAYMNRRNELD